MTGLNPDTTTMASMFSLGGRVALVTGGNSGLGLAVARGLAACGAHVEVWGRRADANADAVACIAGAGGRASSRSVDVTVEEAVGTAMDDLVARQGRVDVVVASAGIAEVTRSTAALDTEQWRRVMAVDLDGVMFTFRAALTHMVAGGDGGSLVAVGSRLAANGQPRAAHYSAAKAGLGGLVRAIAVEYGPQGIRANLVAAGWFDTPMTAPVIARPRVAEAQLPRIPLRRWGRSDELAGVVVYLASNASSYHTGDTLTVDGGGGLG